MTQEVTEALTADERTILEIASFGEFMIETGRWHDPIMSLVKKGYMEGPQFNRYITEAGRKAFGAHAAEKEAAEDAMYRDLEVSLRKQAVAQKTITEKLKGIPELFAEVARISSEATGKAASYDLDQWARQVIDQAKAILRAG
jgi:hypothetical protein